MNTRFELKYGCILINCKLNDIIVDLAINIKCDTYLMRYLLKVNTFMKLINKYNICPDTLDI